MKFFAFTFLMIIFAATLVGCETAPQVPVKTTERSAEKALLAGIQSYENAKYLESEKYLLQSLKSGLTTPRDKASAHKHLAFIYCSTLRTAECENSFKAAFQADPGFSLSKSEAGHPLWGPMYQRLRPQ